MDNVEDELEEMRQDALVRAERAWTEVSQQLGRNAPGTDIERIYAAEGRAIRLVCLMLAEKGAKTRSRRSRWTDRGRVLERLDDALLSYLAGIPVGASQDLAFVFDIARTVSQLRRRLHDENAWRRRSQGDPLAHGVAAVAWHPDAKPGPAPASQAIARLVEEYEVDASVVAQLESVARLPVEPFVGLDGRPLLHAWDANRDDTLYLPPGDSRFDSQLRDAGRVKAWERKLKKHSGRQTT